MKKASANKTEVNVYKIEGKEAKETIYLKLENGFWRETGRKFHGIKTGRV